MIDLKCYDLCCGAGALSEGFRAAGAQLLGGIDMDKGAVETARANHSSGSWELVSIEALADLLAEGSPHVVREANCILAGLPCQGFSAAGKREACDPRNLLYRQLVRIVARVTPEFVVIENVPGIRVRRNAGVFHAIKSEIAALGYRYEERTLRAFDFGVPQLRKRVFLVFTRGWQPSWVFDSLPKPSVGPTVREALRGIPSGRQIKRLSHTFMDHGTQVVRKLRRLEPGGPISYRRLSWSEPAPTLVAGHRALPVHPKQPRAISVREAARLQGFPDSYLFRGSRSSQIEQVANAVPPPMARAVARAIRRLPEYRARVFGTVYLALKPKADSQLKLTLGAVFEREFREHGRPFPWRKCSDPFKVLVTEMLLQRTNGDLASTVWREVISLVPTPSKAAGVDLRRLAPLIRRIGLPGRARVIREVGGMIRTRHNGRTPSAFDELLRLPGVGIYMASAVRAFAFGELDFPIDSNAFRFMSRFFGLGMKGKKTEARQLRESMLPLVPRESVREYIYGFLDFAARICRPQEPACDACELRSGCEHWGASRNAAGSPKSRAKSRSA